MNQTAKEILDANIDKYFVNVPLNERSDFARKLPVPAYEVALKAMEEYGQQQIETAEENATWAHDQLHSTQEELLYYKDKCSKQAKRVKQVTEERDKAVRLLLRCSRVYLPEVLQDELDEFINSLNAAGSDTGTNE